MKLSLKGKRALVSGSTAGIGLAIARGLAATEATVVVNGRTDERVEQAITTLQQEVPDGVFEGVTADVATSVGAQVLVERAGEIDVLINNVGIIQFEAFTDISDDDWRRLYETNVMSGVRLSRAYLPQMIARNWGRIVFVSSESALMAPVEAIHYGVTKTAQLSISRGLAQMAKGTGVTVNSVIPGPTRSEGMDHFIEDIANAQDQAATDVAADFVQQFRPSSLINRLAEPEEVANAVVYLSSSHASATTGAAVRVDGGAIPYIV